MIDVVVVDTSAESRNRLADQIIKFQSEVQQKNPTCPQLSVRIISLHELPFAEQPDVCVIGSECLTTDLVEIATIRNHIPESVLIAECSLDLSNLVIIEQMSCLGVNDVIHQNTKAEDFFRKLVLLNKKQKAPTTGKLIVFDSGKGGTGVTSIVAAIGSSLVGFGLKVAVVDLDSDTQDLTRFLGVRPVINENLNAMLTQERAVVREFVEQAIVPVQGSNSFVCIAPSVNSLQALAPRTPVIRNFLSFIEQVDHLYDVVLVDLAGIRGGLSNALLRVADNIIFVTNPEPGSMFATTQIIKDTLRLTPHPDSVKILHNSVSPGGMHPTLAQTELLKYLKLDQRQSVDICIPFNSAASKWPGSGATMDIIAGLKFEKVFKSIVVQLGLVNERRVEVNGTASFFQNIKSGFISLIEKKKNNRSALEVNNIVSSNLDISLPIVGLNAARGNEKSLPISLPVFNSE